jgi:hypothetical protein
MTTTHSQTIFTTLQKIKQGTAIEIAAFCPLMYSQVVPRMAAMEREGLVVRTGKKGKSPANRSAIVWRLACSEDFKEPTLFNTQQ